MANSNVPASQAELLVSATGDTASPAIAAASTKEHFFRGCIIDPRAAGTVKIDVGDTTLLELFTLTAGQLFVFGGFNLGAFGNKAITITCTGLGAGGSAKLIHTTVPRGGN
jgi:hypothetical protein